MRRSRWHRAEHGRRAWRVLTLTGVPVCQKTEGMKNEVIVHQAGIVGLCPGDPAHGREDRLARHGRGRDGWGNSRRRSTRRTAAIFYFYNLSRMAGQVPLEEGIAIAHRHGIPLIVDAAAQLPPVENLWRFTQMGADLAIFSGG